MTTAIPATGAAGATVASPNATAPADVLVVFGITGDLAKVMTFHSLYRLEQRGLLDCPIVGVAVDDWTVEDLRERARECDRRRRRARSTRRCSTASPTRLSYVAGDFGDAATFARVARRDRRTRAARSSTSRSRRSCSGR